MLDIDFDLLEEYQQKINSKITSIIDYFKFKISEISNELINDKSNVTKIYLSDNFGHIELNFSFDGSIHKSWSTDLLNEELSKKFTNLENYLIDNKEYFLIAIKNNDEEDIILWERN